MLDLNLNEATDWQRRLLDHIYVYDKNRTGTVLLFDNRGNPLEDITAQKSSPLKIPIQDMKPENRSALLERVKAYFQSEGMSDRNVKIYSPSVILYAERSIQRRPPGHLYTPTEEEQRQIVRVFVEANKYPEVPYALFNTEHDSSSPAILMAMPGRNDTTHLSYPRKSVGFYCRGTVGIVERPGYALRFTVSEELLHALDARLIRPQFSAQDCADLITQANRVLHTSLHDRWSGNASSSSPSVGFSMAEFRKRTTQLPRKPQYPDFENRLLLIQEVRGLREIAGFIKNPGYKNNKQVWDTELFAKLAKFILLRRHRHRNSETELERRVEGQLYDTAAGKAVINTLDELRQSYETLPEQEKAQAERFAEKSAKAVEALLPGSTLYERISRRNDEMRR